MTVLAEENAPADNEEVQRQTQFRLEGTNDNIPEVVHQPRSGFEEIPSDAEPDAPGGTTDVVDGEETRSVEATPSLHGRSIGCAELDMSLFSRGRTCGSPLSEDCFDSSRCGDEHAPQVYVYDFDCSLEDSDRLSLNGDGLNEHHIAWYWRRILHEKGQLSPTYESACIFISVNRDPGEPCAVRAPLWNDGANHLMVDFSDDTR